MYADGDWCYRDRLVGRAILPPINANVNAINETMVARFPGDQAKISLSADRIREGEITNEEMRNILYEYLYSINISSLPDHKLSLKVGMPLRLLQEIVPKYKPMVLA